MYMVVYIKAFISVSQFFKVSYNVADFQRSQFQSSSVCMAPCIKYAKTFILLLRHIYCKRKGDNIREHVILIM